MSQFIAPIHEKMYQKIMWQEDMTDELLKLGNQKIKKKWQEIDRSDFYSVVDEKNIHGFLQNRLDLAESRLANVVTEMVKNDGVSISILNNIVFDFGERYKIRKGSTPLEAFHYFSALFLDGMPCDGVIAIVEKRENCIVYQEKKNIHLPYWEEAKGDVAHYYQLRKAAMEGMLNQSGLKIYSDEHLWRITYV